MKQIPASDPPRPELQVIEAWLARQASVNTRSAYRTDLETFGRWCAQNNAFPLQADAATIAAFQLAREAAGDSAATLRRRWSSLSSFYRFAIDMDSTEVNPVAGAPRPRTAAGDLSTTQILSVHAVEQYLAVAAALDPRLDALVSLLVFDGLKLGEALALDVGDVAGRPPKVSLMIRRKGSSRRVILGPDSARSVRRCAGRRRSEPLFTSGRPASLETSPRRLTRFGADHLIRQLSSIGDDRVTANALRRFYITSSHRAGTPLEQVRDRAGLSAIRGVQRYL
jgi:site-specific recombinase XerD